MSSEATGLMEIIFRFSSIFDLIFPQVTLPSAENTFMWLQTTALQYSSQAQLGYLKKKKKARKGIQKKAEHINFLRGAVSCVHGLISSTSWACGSVFSQGQNRLINFYKGGHDSHKFVIPSLESSPGTSALPTISQAASSVLSCLQVPWLHSLLSCSKDEPWIWRWGKACALEPHCFRRLVGQKVESDIHTVGSVLFIFSLRSHPIC